MTEESEKKWAKDVELHRGALERLGWKEHEGAEVRHRALERSVREDGWRTTVDRLLFMQNVAGREHNPGLHRTAGDDLDWLRRWEVEDRGEEDARRDRGTEHRVETYRKDDGTLVHAHLAKNPGRK